MQAVVREWFDAPPPRGVFNGRVKCLSGRDAGASRSSSCLTLVWLWGSFAPWCTITCTRTAEKSRVGPPARSQTRGFVVDFFQLKMESVGHER